MGDAIIRGVQTEVDRTRDGWVVAHYAIAVGLQRITVDGTLESTTALYTPSTQPPYATEGLLLAGDRIRARTEAQ